MVERVSLCKYYFHHGAYAMRIKIGGIKSDVVDDVVEVADFLID
jgi:hypothetical protein